MLFKNSWGAELLLQKNLILDWKNALYQKKTKPHN